MSQDAGLPRDTAQQDVRHWNNNYEAVWMRERQPNNRKAPSTTTCHDSTHRLLDRIRGSSACEDMDDCRDELEMQVYRVIFDTISDIGRRLGMDAAISNRKKHVQLRCTRRGRLSD